jgi:hypothetical protein
MRISIVNGPIRAPAASPDVRLAVEIRVRAVDLALIVIERERESRAWKLLVRFRCTSQIAWTTYRDRLWP